MTRRNPNRGVVLTLADAYAIHRWLEFVMDERKFWNPIEAIEAERAAEEAKWRLCGKLVAIADAHERDDEAQSVAR
jgi:hypothetical protein